MTFRICTDHLDGRVAQVTGSPDRAMLRIHKVGAAAGVRDFAHIDQSFELTLLGVDNRDLVGLVGGGHEVTHAAVPAAIVQESCCVNGGGAQAFQILVVHQHDLAGFFYVNNELGVLVRRNDSRNTWLRVVFLGAYSHASGSHDFHRLQSFAIHDHKLRRPVGACNSVLVFIAFVFGGFYGTGFQANLDLGYRVRMFHPQINHVDCRIATNHEQVTARRRHAGYVNRVTGLDDFHNFFGLAINQCNFASITQSNTEQVWEIQAVHLLFWPILGCYKHFPGRFHIGQAPLRGSRWLVHQVLGHHLDFGFGKVT